MNLYIPNIATIETVEPETIDTSTLRVIFDDPEVHRSFRYKPGQFAQISVFGIGECPISITSSPSQKNYLEFCVRSVGRVTKALHNFMHYIDIALQ